MTKKKNSGKSTHRETAKAVAWLPQAFVMKLLRSSAAAFCLIYSKEFVNQYTFFSSGFLLLTEDSLCYFLIKQSLMIKENQALEVCVTSQWTLLFPDPLHTKPPAGFVSKSGAQLRNSGNIGVFWPSQYYLSRNSQTFNTAKGCHHPHSACLRTSQLSYRRKKNLKSHNAFREFVLGCIRY